MSLKGCHFAKFIPEKHRNPYTIWYKYAKQNLHTYNCLAMKYNIDRLQFPLHIRHTN